MASGELGNAGETPALPGLWPACRLHRSTRFPMPSLSPRRAPSDAPCPIPGFAHPPRILRTPHRRRR